MGTSESAITQTQAVDKEKPSSSASSLLKKEKSASSLLDKEKPSSSSSLLEQEAVQTFIRLVNSHYGKCEPLTPYIQLERLLSSFFYTCSNEGWKIILTHAHQRGIKFQRRNTEARKECPLLTLAFTNLSDNAAAIAHLTLDFCEQDAAANIELSHELREECDRLLSRTYHLFPYHTGGPVNADRVNLFRRVCCRASENGLRKEDGLFAKLLVAAPRFPRACAYACVFLEPNFARDDGSCVDVLESFDDDDMKAPLRRTATEYLLSTRDGLPDHPNFRRYMLESRDRIDILLQHVNAACERRIIYRDNLLKRLQLVLFDSNRLAIVPLLALIRAFVVG